ncbi:hypothetical protein HMPREF1624_06787 [Sporothrix schenckii ATCC 58251]|uniref:Nucleoporin NDC1 n=1 Tax=Sporothrix schenckii (strain ATCC 58251 / de Perez 2211183) TaxID=1391915 RepID=U7PQ23_SPOS1|nr:hypothetical protein HMPREF1624_06787 [Sporothrix schenckii ATCC 58251]
MPTATQSPNAAPQSARRVLPYKDFLQPALHRRFSSTALVLLAIAYAQSLALSSWSAWLWAWFPLSGAGFRALVIFFCGLVIIILRIAQFHIGIRTSNSPFETFLYNAAKPKTVETVFSYCLAGWLYGQVFRWSAPESATLGWITHYQGDRARLNERALYLVVHVVCVGAVNAVLHLFWDSDRLLLGTARPAAASDGSNGGSSSAAAGKSSQPYRSLLAQLPFLIISAFARAIVGLVTSVIVYNFFVRPIAWRFTLALFRPFFSLPKSSLPPSMKPYFSTWTYLPRCFQAGFLFTLLVVVGNAAFSLFLVNEPLKDGRPLTSDSKDPNGSLLNGLKSRKDKIKAFSTWELAFIACNFPDRRVAIYTDIDRKDGSTWSQICKLCLDTIKTLENRIDPPAPAVPAPAARSSADDAAPEVKRLTKPVRDDPNILVATPQKKKTFSSEMEKMVNKVAIDPQNSPRLSPLTKQVLQDARKRLQNVQRDISGPENPNSSLQNTVRQFLALPIVGWPFRLRFQNRITAAVLGGPYGEPSVYVNAINALCLLAVHSLQEDKFGNVQRDVAMIVREFTRVTRKLEGFKASYPLHWTDVEAERVCPEVDAILDAFKDSLTDLIANFGQYSRDLRLSQTDMRLAEEAATAGRESQEEPQPADGDDANPEMAELRS